MVNDRRFNPVNPDDSDNSSIPLPKPPAWMQPIRETPAEPPPEPPKPPTWMQPMRETPSVPVAPRPPSRPVTSNAESALKSASAPPERVQPAPSAKPGEPEVANVPQVVSEHLTHEVEYATSALVEDEFEEDEDADAEIDPDDHEEPLPFVDPALAYVILVIVTALGLYNLAADTRFTIVWSALTVLGAASIAADRLHVERPNLRDLFVGVGYGALIGVPMMIIAAPALQRLSFDIFGRPGDAFVFQALAFAMPMGETLFFRGAIQQSRGLLVTVLAASLWSLMLFLPAMNVSAYPLVAIVISLSLCVVNFLYSYLAERVGLFSAWTCQTTISLLLLWVPRLFR